MTQLERINGRRIGIIGMARSGMAAADLAARHGGLPFVSDAAPAERLTEQIAVLNQRAIAHETGEHSATLLTSDYIVLSPGVPLTLPILVQAQQQGIPLFSELEFASWLTPAPIIAITGSNGKTTTTTLVGELLAAAGRHVAVCGNIGTPLAAVASSLSEQSVAVVETSSFQLATIADFRPRVAAILNISPDHLDWHGGFVGYKKAKYRITENQTTGDLLVLNADDHDLTSDQLSTSAEIKTFSIRADRQADVVVRDGMLAYWRSNRLVPILPVAEIRIPGPHNVQNAAAAALMVEPFGVPVETIAAVLRSFAGVEHRLESVATIAGISFVNDSKATNVDSAASALLALPGPLLLIMGGRDKGASYKPLIELGAGKIRHLLLIGEAKDKIFAELGQHFQSEFAESLEQAVQRAFAAACPGETVLLSPGCSSFDMFDNFEHRGRVFKQSVHALKNGKHNRETIAR